MTSIFNLCININPVFKPKITELIFIIAKYASDTARVYESNILMYFGLKTQRFKSMYDIIHKNVNEYYFSTSSKNE